MIKNYYVLIRQTKISVLLTNFALWISQTILTYSVKFFFCDNHFIPCPLENKSQINSRIWLFLFANMKVKKKIINHKQKTGNFSNGDTWEEVLESSCQKPNKQKNTNTNADNLIKYILLSVSHEGAHNFIW